MAKNKAANKAERKTKKVSLRQCVVLAKEYLEGDTIIKTGKAKQDKAKATITEEFADRGIDSYIGGGLKITRVQTSSMQYDSDGIWDDLTAQQRKLCYVPTYNFAALDADRQRELMALIRKELSTSELALVRSFRMDVSALAQAVEAGKIDAKVVAAHAEEKKNAPFIRVTPAGAE